MRTVNVIKVVRIGNTAMGNPRFRFYTSEGSFNSRADSAYCHRIESEDVRLRNTTAVLDFHGGRTVRAVTVNGSEL